MILTARFGTTNPTPETKFVFSLSTIAKAFRVSIYKIEKIIKDNKEFLKPDVNEKTKTTEVFAPLTSASYR